MHCKPGSLYAATYMPRTRQHAGVKPYARLHVNTGQNAASNRMCAHLKPRVILHHLMSCCPEKLASLCVKSRGAHHCFCIAGATSHWMVQWQNPKTQHFRIYNVLKCTRLLQSLSGRDIPAKLNQHGCVLLHLAARKPMWQRAHTHTILLLCYHDLSLLSTQEHCV
jgi:hypothetical protein